MNPVLLGETINAVGFVLEDPPDKVTSDADVKRTADFTRKDIDEIT